MSLDLSFYRVQETCVFDTNITHNLSDMAMEVGIYECLWRPEEYGYTLANDLIKPLEAGLERLKKDPKHFKSFNPSNGWGDYEGLIKFVENVLTNAKDYPDARVSSSR